MRKEVSATARRSTVATVLLALAVSTGCDRSLEFAPERIQTKLVVMPAAGGKPSYFRARAISVDTRSDIEHFAALGRQAEKQCAGRSTVMLPSSTIASKPIPAGGQAVLDFRCADSTAPNRTTVAAGQLADDPTPIASGVLRISAWSGFGGGDQRNELLAYRDLLGGLIRDVYVDRCRNGAVGVERVATVVESAGGIEGSPDVKRIQVTLDYRCLNLDTVTGVVAT